MKKSNWLIYALIVLASIFLLWLWYYLEFNHIDSPLDLIISIIWWIVVAATIIFIVRIEKKRKERIRTMYVGDQFFFNSEAGTRSYSGSEQLIERASDTLKKITYDFSKYDLPDLSEQPIKYLIRTKSFNEDEWQGEIQLAGEEQSESFKDQHELSRIVNQVRA